MSGIVEYDGLQQHYLHSGCFPAIASSSANFTYPNQLFESTRVTVSQQLSPLGLTETTDVMSLMYADRRRGMRDVGPLKSPLKTLTAVLHIQSWTSF